MIVVSLISCIDFTDYTHYIDRLRLYTVHHKSKGGRAFLRKSDLNPFNHSLKVRSINNPTCVCQFQLDIAPRVE